MSVAKQLGNALVGKAVRRKVGKKGILGAGLGLIATRLALRSLPGAALVGGGLVAKHFWDRYRARAAWREDMSEEDAEMGVARAQGEPDIAEAGMPGAGVAAVA